MRALKSGARVSRDAAANEPRMTGAHAPNALNYHHNDSLSTGRGNSPVHVIRFFCALPDERIFSSHPVFGKKEIRYAIGILPAEVRRRTAG